MSPDDPGPPIPVAPTPTTTAGPLPGDARPPAWPVVLGIIAIVLGAAGMVGGCFGAVATQFFEMLTGMMPEGQTTGMEGMVQWQGWITGMSIVGGIIGALLLAGGIGLVQRRAWAVTACVVWALLKVCFVVVNAGVGFMVNQAQLEAMQQDPNMPPMPGGFFTAIGAVGTLFGVVWGWALPVFLLIWFARGSIRKQVAGWGAAPEPFVPPAA